MVAYLDAATERRERQYRAEWEAAVETVRVGTIFAHDQKAYTRWQRTTTSRQPGLTGASLEHAVMRLAQTNPEYVVVGA